MTDPDTAPRLAANTALLAALSTIAANALAASDWTGYGNALGRLQSAVDLCFEDAGTLAPDPLAMTRAYDRGSHGEGP
jgi:hypothetical protein